MKILKRGNPPGPWWAGIWVCSECHSEWEIDKGDNVVSGDDKRDGPFAHMACPVCGKDTWTSPKGMAQRHVADMRPDWQS